MATNHLHMSWLGFGAFYIITPGGMKILIDPWVGNNPLFPAEFKDTILDCDIILLTHGHRDHAEDAVDLAKQTGATVVAGWELAQLLLQRGVEKVMPINKGGTRALGEISVTAVYADHSGAFVENGNILYGGDAMGYVIRLENGFTLYHAGDTNVFGDMALISELYEPDAAVLPIGDVYTMGPREAAKAAELLQIKEVIPMHFGFDFLTGTPEKLVSYLKDKTVKVHHIKPGDTITTLGK
ncbi:MAG: metal-dependent hydrolase [Bacillota bacterium]|nr:metal-dependent hydrolase [Bacillota bacterium]